MMLLLTFLVCVLEISAQSSQNFNSQCPYLNCQYGTIPNNPCQCYIPNQINQGNDPCARILCGMGQRCALTQVGATCVSLSVNSGPMNNMGNPGNMRWGGISPAPYPGMFIRRPRVRFNTLGFRRPGSYGSNFGPGMNRPFPVQMPNNMNNMNNMMPGNMVPNGNQLPMPFSVPFACTQPMELGRCNRGYSRYYFNRLSGRCETFRYTGCGGNRNNFATFAECQQLCVMPPTYRMRP